MDAQKISAISSLFSLYMKNLYFKYKAKEAY